MKTTLRLSAVAALLAISSLHAQAADGWTWLPILSPGYKAEPTLALSVASTKPAKGSEATAWGIDFNFNCGLIQSPDQRIRTHFNVSHSSEGAAKTTAFELSPRYTVPMGGGWSAGAGPSLGLFKVENGSVSKNLFGAGLAAGVNYRVGQFYTGLDLRYHATSAKNGVDLDPTTVSLKAGVNF
jgi:hypothetical protein